MHVAACSYSLPHVARECQAVRCVASAPFQNTNQCTAERMCLPLHNEERLFLWKQILDLVLEVWILIYNAVADAALHRRLHLALPGDRGLVESGCAGHADKQGVVQPYNAKPGKKFECPACSRSATRDSQNPTHTRVRVGACDAHFRNMGRAKARLWGFQDGVHEKEEKVDEGSRADAWRRGVRPPPPGCSLGSQRLLYILW